MSRSPRPRRSWFGLVLIGLLLMVGPPAALVSVRWPRWREDAVIRALRRSEGPAPWWPPGWREQLRSSILLEGQVLPARTGMIEFQPLSTPSPIFRTAATGGVYSFARRLPAGPCRVRLVSPDGTASDWVSLGPLGSGSHRINLTF